MKRKKHTNRESSTYSATTPNITNQPTNTKKITQVHVHQKIYSIFYPNNERNKILLTHRLTTKKKVAIFNIFLIYTQLMTDAHYFWWDCERSYMSRRLVNIQQQQQHKNYTIIDFKLLFLGIFFFSSFSAKANVDC